MGAPTGCLALDLRHPRLTALDRLAIVQGSPDTAVRPAYGQGRVARARTDCLGVLVINIKRLCLAFAAALLSLLLLPVVAGPAQAASAVRIGAVQYNSPGSDTGSNTSLNAEWVRITNHSSVTKTLTGWTLRDTSNHVYKFGTYKLGAGKSVRIHTGKGSNTSANRYQGRDWYVWNNTHDKAILKNSAGTTVSTRSW